MAPNRCSLPAVAVVVRSRSCLLYTSPEAAHFAAGILHHARELTAFLNPIPNSYSRLGCYEAPLYVTWSRQNRSQMIRIFSEPGRRGYVEIRNRCV